MSETEDRAASYAEEARRIERRRALVADVDYPVHLARAFLALADAEQAPLRERVAELEAEVAGLTEARNTARLRADMLQAAEADVGQIRDEIEAWGEFVPSPCSVGHQVAVNDGDGGVYTCPACRVKELEAERDRLAQTLDRVRAFAVSLEAEQRDRDQRGRAAFAVGDVAESIALASAAKAAGWHARELRAILPAPAADQPTEGGV